MVVILMAKKLSALYPIDETGEVAMKRVGQGEIVTVDIKRPRNLAFHRRFFAMLNIIYQNQDAYKSLEDLLNVCKLRVGHCDTLATKYGEVKIPRSISFAAMDDAEFSEFYGRAVDWMLQEVIPGLKRKDLDQEFEAQLMEFAK